MLNFSLFFSFSFKLSQAQFSAVKVWVDYSSWCIDLLCCALVVFSFHASLLCLSECVRAHSFLYTADILASLARWNCPSALSTPSLIIHSISASCAWHSLLSSRSSSDSRDWSSIFAPCSEDLVCRLEGTSLCALLKGVALDFSSELLLDGPFKVSDVFWRVEYSTAGLSVDPDEFIVQNIKLCVTCLAILIIRACSKLWSTDWVKVLF